jgi:hypothetical protein
MKDQIKKIIEKHLAPDGYRIVHLGGQHEVCKTKYIKKATIEEMTEELMKRSE